MKKQSLDFTVSITNKCDKNCTHCSENSAFNSESMSFVLAKKIFKKISKFSKYCGITGGEALLYHSGKYNFFDVYKLIKKNNLIPTIMTGGIYDTKEYRNILKKVKGVYFTLSFNLFKPNASELFKNSVEMIDKSNNILSEIFIRYTDNNKKETIKEFKKISKYTILPKLKMGYISRVGKAEQLLKEGEIEYNCHSYSKILHFDINGNIFPCCQVINLKNFSQFSKKHYQVSSNFKKVYREARKFCFIQCPLKKIYKLNQKIDQQVKDLTKYY